MNEKELKEYHDKLMSGAKGTMKLGIMTGVGSLPMGSIGGSVPGAAPGLAAANTALNLANVGNLAAVGMSIIPTSSSKPQSKKPQSKKKLSPMDDPASFFFK